MTLLGVALCLMTAWWAHQIAGPWAAIAAAAIISLDPTVLAHAPIVKNDIPLTLAMLAAMIATWCAGRRLTALNALRWRWPARLRSTSNTQRFFCRRLSWRPYSRLDAAPWAVFGRQLQSKGARLSIIAAMVLLMLIVTIATTWAAYGFHYSPSSDPSMQFQTDEPFTGPIDRVVNFAGAHRLLPQAFCVGFLRQHAAIGQARNFLLGSVSERGWWYYFPFAFLVKTPLSTLIAIGLAIFICWRFEPRCVPHPIDGR